MAKGAALGRPKSHSGSMQAGGNMSETKGVNNPPRFEPGPGQPGESPGLRPRFMVVSKRDHFEPSTTDYALSVAERLGADILAVSVNTIPEYYDGDEDGHIGAELVFAAAATHSAESFHEEARARGVRLEHVCRSGKVSTAVSRLYHEIRHLSFILLEPGIRKEDIADLVPVPVFTMVDPAQAAPSIATPMPAVGPKGSAVIRHSKTKGEKI